MEEKTENLIRDVAAIQKEMARIEYLEEGVTEIRQQMKKQAEQMEALLALLGNEKKTADKELSSQVETPASKNVAGNADGGDGTGEDSDQSRSTPASMAKDRTPLTRKIKLPVFDGEGAANWVLKSSRR
ncbi:unnamed protein product [Cochlearia groenlandica]